MFLYVALMLEELADESTRSSARAVEETLDNLPRSIHDV